MPNSSAKQLKAESVSGKPKSLHILPVENSEKRFRELVDFLPEIVFETDLRGRLTYVNQAGFDCFGYSQEDFEKGLNTLQILSAEDRDRGRVNMGRVLNGEKAR